MAREGGSEHCIPFVVRGTPPFVVCGAFPFALAEGGREEGAGARVCVCEESIQSPNNCPGVDQHHHRMQYRHARCSARHVALSPDCSTADAAAASCQQHWSALLPGACRPVTRHGEGKDQLRAAGRQAYKRYAKRGTRAGAARQVVARTARGAAIRGERHASGEGGLVAAQPASQGARAAASACAEGASHRQPLCCGCCLCLHARGQSTDTKPTHLRRPFAIDNNAVPELRSGRGPAGCGIGEAQCIGVGAHTGGDRRSSACEDRPA